MKYAVVGYGKLGRTICEILKSDALPVAPECKTKTLFDVKESFDVIIDFSHPDNLDMICQFIKTHPCPLVIGTTGFSESDIKKIKEISSIVPVCLSSNFSIGILAVNLAVKGLAKILDDFDISIIEEHHKTKIDAPSGTAKMLESSIENARSNVDISMHSVRAGNVVGNHQVKFYGDDEVVTISHSANSRKIFALGAIKTANLLVKKPARLYTFEDIFKMENYEKI